MKLVEFSVKHSLFVNFLSVVIAIAGIFSLFRLQREAFPNITFGWVSVSTVYPGSAPDEIEKLISIPIEKELKSVDGIDEMWSSSEEGSSSIFIKLDPDAKDQYRIVNDIQRAVDRVPDLPADLEDKPVVTEIKTKDHPIIVVSLTGEMPEAELMKHAETLEDELLDIDGVSAVVKNGWRDRQMWVEVDPKKSFEKHVSLLEVIRALSSHNVAVPGGKIDTGVEDLIVRTTGEFKTTEEIKKVVVRSSDFGSPLKVSDVADVRERLEEETILTKTDGRKAINLVVKKKEKKDAIDLVAEVKKTVETYRNAGTIGLNVAYVNDLSYYIERRLNVLTSNAYLGFFLVVCALFLFLSPSIAIWTAIGIPFSLFMTFIVMNQFGISVNLISMFGLIIVLGMLVDDAIIISENIYRYVEMGMPVKEAALKGGSEVVKPVAAAVLTTIVAFTPLLFVPGISGKFIMNIPITVAIALAASLFEAIIILPSHISDFVRPPRVVDGKIKSKRNSFLFRNILGFYSKALLYALKHRYLVILITLLLLVGSLITAVKTLKINLFPSRGIEIFFVRGEAPVGTTLEKTNSLIIPVEKEIMKLPASELDNIVTTVGWSAQDETDPGLSKGSHIVQTVVYLSPASKRKRDVEEIIDDLRAKVGTPKGFERFSFEKANTGPPVGKPVSINIKGEEYSTLKEIAKLHLDKLKTMKGVIDPRDDYTIGKKEVRVVVDPGKAKSAGLSVADIAASVRYAFEGGVATKIKSSKEEIDVIVKFPEEKANDITTFDRIYVPNTTGNLVPLKAVSTLEETRGIFGINHLDGKRTVAVTAEVNEKLTSSTEVNRKLEKEFADIPVKYQGYTVRYGGEFEETQKSIRSILMAFFISLLLIFMIISSAFNSIIQPIIIMLAIPLGLIGVLCAMLIHGEDLSFMVLIGVVGLSGVVVNDSIVLVDFINGAREQGKERMESIIEAGQTRLRPILLTTSTTALGLISVAYGLGGGDPFLMPMGKALVWGLIFNSALGLIIIPCVYAFMDDINSFLWKLFRKKQKYPGNHVSDQ